MTFPAQNFTVRDPGLGVREATGDVPVMSGIAAGGSGVVETLLTMNNLADVRTTLGYGPLAEDVALALQKNGGPVYAVLHDSSDSKVLTAQALTKLVGAGPTITVSGTPNDRYALRVEVTVGGVIGTSKFKYSLDAHDVNAAPFTYSDVRPTVATYLMANSGLTLAMPAGTYVAGDVYTLACVPKEPAIADLADVGALLIAASSINFHLWSVSGAQPDEVTGAGFAAALSGHLTSLFNTFRYVRGLCDVGSDDTAANINIEAASWTSSRICPAYGYTLRLSALPFEGFSYRKTSMVSGLAVRAFASLISTDLSRFADGPDEGVEKIWFDGFYDQTVDANKISTMRTWPGAAGFYFTNAKLKSAFGSDFTDLQFGRVMDDACYTTYVAQRPFQSAAFRATTAANATAQNPAGAIDPRDAKRLQESVQGALNDSIMAPQNAEGIPGHASAVVYTVNLLQNLVTTQQISTNVGIVPLGYAKIINTTLGFTLNA